MMQPGRWIRPGGLGTVIFALLLVPAASASGAVRYAEPNGDGAAGAGQCLLADPCNLQTAVEDASVVDGDDVIVLTGTYENQASALNVTDSITLHGEVGQPRPVIPMSDASDGIFVTDSATIRHLQINYTGPSRALTMLTSGGVAERLVVKATGGGHACLPLVGVLIRDSICWTTVDDRDAVSFSTSGAIAGTATLRNVTAIAAGNSGNAVRVEAGSGADLTLDAKNVIASGGLPGSSGGDMVVETNSAVSTSATINADFSNYDSRLETGTAAAATSAGSASNQTPAPQFVDAGSGDFHQLAGSPTINAGSSAATLLGSLDIDGEARTLGPAPDIGADELADSDPPETTIDSGPSGPTNDPTPTFTFSSDEPGSTFECRFDSESFAPCSGVGSHTPGAPIGEGAHTFEVKATDGFANTDATPASAALSIDATKPVLSPGSRSYKDGKVKFNFTANEPSSFTCQLKSGPTAACTSPVTYKVTKAGKYAIIVVGTDAAGNVGILVHSFEITKKQLASGRKGCRKCKQKKGCRKCKSGSERAAPASLYGLEPRPPGRRRDR